MKKKLIIAGLIGISSSLLAQVSYNSNAVPITGVNNAAFGISSLTSNTSGNHNTASGNFALGSNTTGYYNSAHGLNALAFNTTGYFNSAIGGAALYLNQNGINNTACGLQALRNNVSGSWNTATGSSALHNNSGSYNTADGYQALYTNQTGGYNTAIGSGADVGNIGLSNASAIGANAKVMNSNQMILGDNSVVVGIGLSGNAAGPQARLHSVDATRAIKGEATATGIGTGVEGTGYIGVSGSGTLVGLDGVGGFVGVRGQSYGSANVGTQYGAQFYAGFGATNYGGYFQGLGGASGVVTYGVNARINQPNLGGTNYGVYATVSGNHNLGTGPNYAGYFDGDVVTAGGSYFYSDMRIKKDVSKIKNSMSVIKKLNPVNYNFDVEGNANIALPSELQYGFISQEVQKIIPEFTKTLIHPAKLDENGKEIAPKKEVLGLNYIGFIALLTKGMQEQQSLIEALNDRLISQEQLITELSQKSSNTTGINNFNPIETGFQMSQNEPNPFTHETVVKYTLPQTVSNAFMAVYDLTGKQITTFPIDQKGSSSVTLTSEKLAAGIYIYSIVADGKVVDSKRMIVAEK